MTDKRSFAVIGLGTFGAAVARTLRGYGDHVLGIDADERLVARDGDRLSRAIIADARELRAMEEAGLGSYDVVVVAMATDIEANLMAVMNAQTLGVPTVWAKAASDTHAAILERVGVQRILRPESSFAELMAQALHNPRVRGSVRLTGDLHVAQIEAPDGLCGKALGRLRLGPRYDLRCVGIVRGAVVLPAEEAEEVCEGDGLLLVGTRPAMRAFSDRA